MFGRSTCRGSVSRRFNALLEKVFEAVYKRLDTSRGGNVDAKGSPLSPVSLFPVPGPRQAASPTRELSSFAMHNNLPRIIHIHKWRMHIRDKFPRGVPPHPPVPTLQSVNYFLAKLKAGGSSCV